MPKLFAFLDKEMQKYDDAEAQADDTEIIERGEMTGLILRISDIAHYTEIYEKNGGDYDMFFHLSGV